MFTCTRNHINSPTFIHFLPLIHTPLTYVLFTCSPNHTYSLSFIYFHLLILTTHSCYIHFPQSHSRTHAHSFSLTTHSCYVHSLPESHSFTHAYLPPLTHTHYSLMYSLLSLLILLMRFYLRSFTTHLYYVYLLLESHSFTFACPYPPLTPVIFTCSLNPTHSLTPIHYHSLILIPDSYYDYSLSQSHSRINLISFHLLILTWAYSPPHSHNHVHLPTLNHTPALTLPHTQSHSITRLFAIDHLYSLTHSHVVSILQCIGT